MVLGFNHNLVYKGEVFHVQSEDSGVSNPHIITVLYRGGVIISSKKICYADILKTENLEAIVEDLMKEQHKEMMRRLKAGDFDEKAFSVTVRAQETGENPSFPDQASKAADSSEVTVQNSMNEECTLQAAKSAPTAENIDEAIRSFFGSRKD